MIAKLNKSNKLVEKYKKLVENSLEKMKEFEFLNMNLDAKLVLSTKLVDELKCENESLKMHAKCLIVEPVAKKEDNICYNHVVVLDFVPKVSSTSKTNRCTFLDTKYTKKWRERLLSPSLCLGHNLRLWMDLSLFQLVTIVV